MVGTLKGLTGEVGCEEIAKDVVVEQRLEEEKASAVVAHGYGMRTEAYQRPVCWITAMAVAGEVADPTFVVVAVGIRKAAPATVKRLGGDGTGDDASCLDGFLVAWPERQAIVR